MTQGFHVGLDVGGTFTDLACVGDDGTMTATKVPNVGSDPATDVIAGLDDLADRVGIDRREFYTATEVIVHGTTVATNAVLTGEGARTGLLTTRGFRDALEMRRGIRERLYDNRYPPPPPLVPRYLRLGVTERIDAAGNEIEPLDEAGLAAAIAELRNQDVESVAVCFMHAYRNGVHEARAGEILDREWPEAHVSLSHLVLPERRFYERVSSTVIGALVGPILAGYLERLVAELAALDFVGALRIMKSNGGLMAPEVASRREAAHTLLSGPAGAVAGAISLSKAGGHTELIVMDMGGTSCDVSLIEGGAALVTRDGSVARYRLMLPMLDIHTVGAGGGSIARVDEAGLLQVGPASAGADPGPACYRRGGDDPTVTDADLVLGYIDPAYFLGGRMALEETLARLAIEAKLAEPLGLTYLEAAAGTYRVINATIGAAIREVSVQRGYDPRQFTLLVAGGAGAVHACAIARDIGIGSILVPRDAGVFSAFGMLTTDFRHDFVQACEDTVVGAGADADAIRAAFAEMSAEGDRLLRAEGVAVKDISHMLKLDLRYAGQIHEVELTIDAADLDEQGMPTIQKEFHRRHARTYTYATEDDPVEIVNLRVTSIGKAWGLDRQPLPVVDADPDPTRKGSRVAHFDDAGAIEVDVFDGTSLLPAAAVAGPAIVELPDTNIVVDPHFDLTCDPYGDFVLLAREP